MSDRFPFGMADRTPDQWGWGTVVDPTGEVIPPGACDGLHNKEQQRDLLK